MKLIFIKKDVAEWIGHSNSRMMLQSIDEDEKTCVNNPYALKGQKEQWFLTENGLYEVLMQSRKPIAKEFKTTFIENAIFLTIQIEYYDILLTFSIICDIIIIENKYY